MDNAKKIARLLIQEIEYFGLENTVLDYTHEHNCFEEYKTDLLDVTNSTRCWFWGQVRLISNILEEHTM